MNHPTEEQLVLHYYGEELPPVDEHLASCEACRGEFRKLQRILNTVDSLPVPERTGAYGTEVWNRLRPQLGYRTRRFWFGGFDLRRLALVAVTICVIAAAFFAGRYAQKSPMPSQAASAARRERVLLVAVGDHLERSQVVLAELSNLGAGRKGRVDISYEQRAADDLVDSSRLFRMTAASTGDNATAALLDELERVLLDIARGPSEVSPEQLEDLQKRIADAGILFKVRVFASHVEQRETDAKDRGFTTN